MSVTHGHPRQHVWTFTSAHDEVTNTACPCIHPSQHFGVVIPSFVGDDYYCETGSRTRGEQRYYFEDPLWDGEGCEGESECCDRGGPSFCKQLPQPTQEDIELRVCRDEQRNNEDIVLEQIELYIQ